MDSSDSPTANRTSRYFPSSTNHATLANRGLVPNAVVNMGAGQLASASANSLVQGSGDTANASISQVPPELAPYLTLAQQQRVQDYPRAASELHEVVEMNKVVKELLIEDLRITCRFFPYGDVVVRHMLYGRIWGKGNGPPTLTSTEAEEMILYRGKFMTRQAVLEEVLAVVELLADDMTRDPNVDYADRNDPEVRLMDWVKHTSPAEETSVEAGSTMTGAQRETQTRPPSATGDRLFRTHSEPSVGASNAQRSEQRGYDTQRQVNQRNQGSVSSPQTANPAANSVRGPFPNAAANAVPRPFTNPAPNAVPGPYRGGPQGGQVTNTTPMAYPQPQNAQQPAFLPMTAASMPPTYVTAGPTLGQHYPFPGVGPTPFQPGMPPHMYGAQLPHFAGGYMPQVQHQQWAMGNFGYPYRQVQPQMPFFPPQPFFSPQAGPYQAASRPQAQVSLDPFPNGSTTTSAAMAMASSITETPTPASAGLSRALPPASNRQARNAYHGSSFNVAAWAQEHRPPTPPKAGTDSAAASVHNVEWKNRFGMKPGSGRPTPDPPILGYRAGSDAMFPQTSSSGPSNQLQDLVHQGAPKLQAMGSPSNLPFRQAANDSMPAQWGVMKIGNIPYGLTKAEVVAFLGKNAKIVTPDLGSPIHIIMDRLTGKTLDCYVEFFSAGDAQAAVNAKTRLGQIHKLGDRVAIVEMSSQDELMKQLFPKAKNIEWDNGWPMVVEMNELFNTGFKSFVTNEELVMLVKHAEFPQRSTYTTRCPQRTYESMISTLYKYPFHRADLTTLAHRTALFDALTSQIRCLVSLLKRNTSYSAPAVRTSAWSATYGATGLTHSLLEEILYAGLNCAGFSERQKWEMVRDAEVVGEKVRMSPLGRWWPFEVVGRAVGVEEDVMEYYIHHLTSHLAPSNQSAHPTPPSANPFRSFSVPLLPKRQNETIEEQGAHEMALLMNVYGYMLPSGDEEGVEMRACGRRGGG